MATSLLTELSLALGMSSMDIMKIILTAPRRYKVYAIPKRSGVGSRIIAQPARELKTIQRHIISERLRSLRIHPAAMAYRQGRSIQDNAMSHVDKRVIMKLDFTDFFHSIVYEDLEVVLSNARFAAIRPEDWRLLRNIFFWLDPTRNRLCLSIGAPSSPFISNVIMEPLDREFASACKQSAVVYTRYADDITLSANSIEALLAAEREIIRIVARCKRPKLSFNQEKRGIFTTAGRRLVTGLVLTPDGKISLGRDRKRQISAAVHHIATGRVVTQDHLNKTRGWLAYAMSVEPTFFETMVRKYGSLVRRIMRMPRQQTSDAVP